MTKILLTGSTGLMGSSLLVRFLAEGLEVIAPVRASSDVAARHRLEEIVAEQFAIDERPEPTDWRDRLVVVAGDIGDGPALAEALRPWREAIEVVWHCAACTNFVDEGACQTVNLEGTKTMMGLAEELSPRIFHHVSTAYVSGAHEGLVVEDELPPRAPNNAYEATKWEAEALIRAWKGVPWTICRPSIIVGNRATGKVRDFKNFYLFLKYFLKLSRRPGKLPLRFPGSPDHALNLVPLDHVIDGAWAIQLRGEAGRCYNLVNADPPSLRQLMDGMGEVLGVPCLTYVDPAEDLGEEEGAAVARFQEFLPYLFKGPRFGLRRATELLGDLEGSTLPPPELKRIIAVFAEANRKQRKER